MNGVCNDYPVDDGRSVVRVYLDEFFFGLQVKRRRPDIHFERQVLLLNGRSTSLSSNLQVTLSLIVRLGTYLLK